MMKTFVLDTNVLLHNANSLESFEDNQVVLPLAVLEELDKFKSNNDELGRNARQVIRRIDAMRHKGRLADGVPTDHGGTLRIVVDAFPAETPSLMEDIPDNHILRVAHHLHRSGERVIFVSKDINARVKADALGLEAVDFEKQKVNFDELYTGFRELTLPPDLLAQFQTSESVTLPKDIALLPHEFAVLTTGEAGAPPLLGRALADGRLAHLSVTSETAWNIKPRSPGQRMALDLLMDHTVPLVTLVGQAGTGKTLLALAAGLDLTLKLKTFDKMLVSRPIMPLGKDIGYLPGDKEAKLMNWMLPIFDNLAYLMRETGEKKYSVRERIERLQKDHIVELEALTYIRGRSISGQYVIVDEAQNLTPHEIKTIISRCGEGGKMVLTGDPYQIDNPYLDSNSNGLTYAVERLKHSPLHGHVTLMKSERSPLAALAAEML
jgi:PhoH-like ATPase